MENQKENVSYIWNKNIQDLTKIKDKKYICYSWGTVYTQKKLGWRLTGNKSVNVFHATLHTELAYERVKLLSMNDHTWGTVST